MIDVSSVWSHFTEPEVIYFDDEEDVDGRDERNGAATEVCLERTILPLDESL